jgi:hypothetical protein
MHIIVELVANKLPFKIIKCGPEVPQSDVRVWHKQKWPDVRVKSVVRGKAEVARLRDVGDVPYDLSAL